MQVEGETQTLENDPWKWKWKRQWIIAEALLYNHITKRGFRIILQQQWRQLSFDRTFQTQEFSHSQRKKHFARLWHPYLPKKKSAMVWLLIAEGHPIEGWQAKINQPGHCNLFPGQQQETTEHVFFNCPRSPSHGPNTRQFAEWSNPRCLPSHGPPQVLLAPTTIQN